MTHHPEPSITVFVVHPNGGYEEKSLPVDDGSTLRELQQEVGGYIERISFDTTDGDLDLWVNEEGMLQRLDINLMAMWLTARLRGSRRPFTEPILGTGVFASGDEEGNTRSLTPAMLAELHRLVEGFKRVKIPTHLRAAHV